MKLNFCKSGLIARLMILFFGVFLLSCVGQGSSSPNSSNPVNPASNNKKITSYSINERNGAITGQNIVVPELSADGKESGIASFTTTGESVFVNGVRQISGVTNNDFTNPVIYTVYAKDGSTNNYTVFVESSGSNLITSYSLNNVLGEIDDNNIIVTVDSSTNLESLVASFVTTGESVVANDNLQISGVTPNNFTTPIDYTVYAANGATKKYTVIVESVSSAKSMTSFSFGDNQGVIVDESISITASVGTNPQNLVATFNTTGKNVFVNGILQVSGVTSNNFTNPVIYTVQADDGSTKNYTVTYTPTYSPNRSSQWDMLDNSTYSIKADESVWAITRGESDLYVGVIDHGSCNVPALSGTYVGGYDIPMDQPDPTIKNGDYHGCGVSGIIAMHPTIASNVTGVAPNVKLVFVNPFGPKPQASFSDVAKAIEWAIGNPVPELTESINPHPVKVLNMSLGSGIQGGPFLECTESAQRAFDDAYAKNIPVVASAGNENTNANTRVVARCNHVIPVGASTTAGNRASYSNYGDIVVVAAPAEPGYPSTGPGAWGYGSMGATSGAAPHVAGVLALMLSVNPDLTVDQMVHILKVTATPFSSVESAKPTGAGIVNALAAVEMAKALKNKNK